MGESKRKRIVVEYFKQLGISKTDDIEKELIKKLGAEKAKPIIEKLEELSPATNEVGTVGKAGLHIAEKERSIDQTELYDFMNQNFTLSMIFHSFSDAEISFRTCSWINDHRDLFSGSILDTGCGNGIVTCFIAKIFPESRVVGVDRSKNSIAIANEIKAKLNLENVTFIYDILGTSVSSDFNTVFSSRTVHENTTVKLTRYKYLQFDEQVAAYLSLYSEYIKTIANKLVDGGRFISFERFDSCDTDYYGFLKALNMSGLSPDFRYYSIIEARETNLTASTSFTITVADKKHRLEENELFSIWSRYAFTNTSDTTRFTKPQIDYYIRENAGNVRFGFISYDVYPDAQSIRCVVYDLRNDQNHFLMHQENSLMSRLNIYENSDETEARMVFEDNKRQDRKNGFTVVDIEPGSKY